MGDAHDPRLDARAHLSEALVLRADGGAGIGLGHLARSLALAEAWSRAGGRAVFATATADVARAAGVHIPLADISPLETGADSEAMARLAREERALWVVCDGYRFDAAYVKRLRDDGLRVLRIVDGQTGEEHQADVLLDQNVGAEQLRYRVNSTTRVLLGTRYALLRETILRHRRRERASGTVRRVLGFAGGADVAQLAPRFVRAFRVVADAAMRCDVVIGPSSATDATALAAAGDDRVAIHRNPADPGTVMAAADLALSAGGSTCWELCYLGVPMAVVAVAENQRRITSGLAAAGAAVDLGWHADLTDPGIVAALEELLADGARRDALSAAARDLVDGQGADRVVAILREETAR